MKFHSLIAIVVALGVCSSMNATTTTTELKDWQFALSPNGTDYRPEQGWANVTIPHDWAIAGAFDRRHDLQTVSIVQNGETSATEKTGRSGGLPWMGSGWYRTMLNISGIEAPQPKKGDRGLRGTQYTLMLDGAMSNAQVFVDGVKVMEWPYGYNSWYCELTPYLTNGQHELSIHLLNEPQSSRWYPGAGLYRKVYLIAQEVVHVPIWGTQITTPMVSDSLAVVNIRTRIENATGKTIRLVTDIMRYGKGQDNETVIASDDRTFAQLSEEVPATQTIFLSNPALWSPETPNRYAARTRVYVDEKQTDEVVTPFGVRTTQFIPTIGFLLNGQLRKFKGVCLHHDMGPLGTAVHVDALRHQLYMLRDMGADAIRTTHNMPSPELVELCDELGIMLIVESFDCWDLGKGDNDYHKYFGYVETHKTLRNHAQHYAMSPNPNLYTWAERDMINMIHHYRNNPSVMMWSIGNEVWNQTKADGWKTAKFLQDICHREDPTRLVTCGMDQVWAILDNNFAATIDIPGLNYRTARYLEAYQKLPQKLILGSETASTVSSRGTYRFPVEIAPDRLYDDHQCSGYDVEYCSWSGLPDQDFALMDDYPWTIGQFVWTGFDYLGEPAPYDTDAWPSHSSYFGIIDLASLPKDRYYLYRSQWNKREHTLHMLPHWTWPGREGKCTPVMVYTSYPEAELIINGTSMGRKQFASANDTKAETVRVGDFKIADWGCAPRPDLLPRYRLMWLDAVYQPGEVKVLAYANVGDSVAVDSICQLTATGAHHLTLEWANEQEHKDQNKEGLYYFTVSLRDAHETLCPDGDQLIDFKITGQATLAGVANGDAASLDPLQQPHMHLFAGMCTIIVKATGEFTLTATPAAASQPKGIRSAQWTNVVKKKRK